MGGGALMANSGGSPDTNLLNFSKNCINRENVGSWGFPLNGEDKKDFKRSFYFFNLNL